MKKLIFFFILFNICTNSYSQSISCKDLKEEIEEEADLENSVICFWSSALVKAEYYSYDGEGFVVVNLKSNDYDFRGRPLCVLWNFFYKVL